MARIEILNEVVSFPNEFFESTMTKTLYIDDNKLIGEMHMTVNSTEGRTVGSCVFDLTEQNIDKIITALTEYKNSLEEAK